MSLDALDFGRPAWQSAGACLDLPRATRVDLFFPGQGSTKKATTARAICATCPVQADCLAWAVEHRERGIWGGTTERERRRIVQEQKVPHPPKPIPHGRPGGYKAHRKRGEPACTDCLAAHAAMVARGKARRNAA